MTTKLKEISFSKEDQKFALCAIFCGFMYWTLPGDQGVGIGGTLLVFIMVTFGLIYMRSKGYKQNKRSLIPLAIIILCGINLFIFDNTTERSLAFLFAKIVYIYWIAATTGYLAENRFSLYTVAEMGRKVFVVPFANFGICAASIFYGNRGIGKGKELLAVLAGLVLAVPLMVIVTSLLVSADASFARVMARLPEMLSGQIMTIILRVVFGIPVAFYLYGLLYGETRGRYALTTKESMDRVSSQVAVIPGAGIYVVMACLCTIYLAFMIVQAGNLFGGFGGNLPADTTYSEFARGGFFQLCIVAVINGTVCGFSYIFIREDRGRTFRLFMGLMSVFTLLLCVTAMSKMLLYIKSYGLTQLRVYTFWFMILVVVICILVILRQIRDFNGTRVGVIAFVICFMILIYGNVDGRIAEYNVDRYEAGTLKAMDEGSMFCLSAGAAPHLIRAYENTEDEEFKRDIRFILEQYVWNQPSDWRNFNIQKSSVAIPKGLW